MIESLPIATAVVLASLGLYAAIFKRNLIKVVIGISILESAVNLFLIEVGYRAGSVAPIYTNSPGGMMSFPTPQALVLTSIVIGVSVTALLLAFCVAIYRKYGTLNVEEVRRLRG